MIESLGIISNPAGIIFNMKQQDEESCVSFQFRHSQDYSGSEEILIGVVCYASHDQLRVAISAEHDSIQKAIEDNEVIDPDTTTQPIRGADRKSGLSDDGITHQDSFEKFLAETGLDEIDLLAPLRLDRIYIPKPWGQEIWYTGIEERGICSVQGVPLPWLLEAAGSVITGTKTLTPILLKILDPLPEKVMGDLYFELHQEKREVYIVTHIDEEAWPDSIGKIRYGFNPEKIRSYGKEQQFKSAYLACVEEYREVRNKIDGDPRETNPELIAKEIILRNKMDEFTSLRSLIVGDVIQVQPYTPHSLQHGVRVIEFQTPHYERFILSFGQKVLTQDHWDTKQALECVNFNISNEPIQSRDATAQGLIADFEEFTVNRLVLEQGTRKIVETSTYSLIIGVIGTVEVNNITIRPEDGVYIPACVDSIQISNAKPELATVLLAQPNTL